MESLPADGDDCSLQVTIFSKVYCFWQVANLCTLDVAAKKLFPDLIAARNAPPVKASSFPHDSHKRLAGSFFSTKVISLDSLSLSTSSHLKLLPRAILAELGEVTSIYAASKAYIKTMPLSMRDLDTPAPPGSEHIHDDTIWCNQLKGRFSNVICGGRVLMEEVICVRLIFRVPAGPNTGNYIFGQRYSPVPPAECACSSCSEYRRMLPFYKLNPDDDIDSYCIVPLSSIRHACVQMVQIAHHKDKKWLALNTIALALMHNDSFSLRGAINT